MVNRRKKLSQLREKVMEMRDDLGTMERQQSRMEKDVSWRKVKVHTPERTSSYDRRLKSPTFWNMTNPITYVERHRMKRESSISPQRTVSRSKSQQRKRELSPTIMDILNTVDKEYYERSIDEECDSKRERISTKRHAFQEGKRFQNSQFGTERFFPNVKESQKKTYKHERRDPVLNPEMYRQAGIKKISQKSRSPDNPYTYHPHSNNNLFPFASQTLFLQSKGCRKDSNRSSISLSSSLGELVPIKFDPKTPSRRKKSQRKHFSRYFFESLGYPIQFE